MNSILDEQLENPSKKFLQWSSAQACFTYYDKEIPDLENNKPGSTINVELPFSFVPLKEMATIKGWSDKHETGLWSNEVEYTKKERLSVKGNVNDRKTVLSEGLWDDIKEEVKANGGKITKSLYVAVKQGKAFEIWNLQLSGSGMEGFMKFPGNLFSGKQVTINKFEKVQKTKAVSYNIPVLEQSDISKEDLTACKELAKELVDYIAKYKEQTQVVKLSDVNI